MFKITILLLLSTKNVLLQPTSKTKSEEACQKYSEELKDQQLDILVGGAEGDLAVSPHMAALGYEVRDGIQWGCSGAIINDRFVLTAASCLRLNITRVSIGDPRLHGTSRYTQNFEVIKSISHPDNGPSTHYNDIGLIELDKPIKFNKFVKPACLYSKTNIPNSELSSSRWGFHDDEKEAKYLHKVPLRFVNHSECSKSYESTRSLPNGIVEDQQICASSKDKNVAVCFEGGAPLQVFLPGGKLLYGVVGITSFGKVCLEREPDVYTRVSHYAPWIESVVWP